MESGIVVASAALLGALVGSFANVVVHRVPRGASIVTPRSHCPTCLRTLTPLELVPLLSYAALRGRCRGCSARISLRYPSVEAGFAVAFGALAAAVPPVAYPASALLLAAIVTLLACAALIDLDTFTLPDALTLPALALALAAAALHPPSVGLPNLRESLHGAAVGAGTLVLIGRLGGLALRRGRDTRERLWPLSFDTVAIATLAGSVGGVIAAAIGGGLQALGSAVARRPLRLPEPILYAGSLIALTARAAMGDADGGLQGALIGAGAFALLGGVWWAIAERFVPAQEEESAEPIAMGFGDVKLAGVLGALLGPGAFAVALAVAVVAGAVIGGIARLRGGDRAIPFGPYLVAGAAAAWAIAEPLLAWYAALLGF
jgi:leader peptidase (prepilin peptidase) / N-methyltransferase